MIPSAGNEPCPGATCCTLAREALADSEAALLEQVASLEADREGCRLVVSAALTRYTRPRASATPCGGNSARRSGDGDGVNTVFRQVGEARYQLVIDDLGIVLEVDRLRRERHELVGELAVTCRLAGAHVIGDDDLIHLADLNLSSAAARTARAKMLRDRSETELDWASWLERLCVQAIRAERTGTPSRPLQDYELRAEEPNFSIKGWELPRHHAAILFGDGGSLKSYLALYAAGMLVEQHGLTVLYCDWELDGEDHRERLHALFGGDAPTLHYLRCDRALVEETERIRREVGRLGVDYLICDSVGFATPGPPESAEMATGYFRAVRQIGVGGSLHLAHVVKAASTDENKKRFRGLKPFGSAFWSNSARSNWFVRRADDDEEDSDGPVVGLYQQKVNRRRSPDVGFQFHFGSDDVVRCTDLSHCPSLAVGLSVSRRIQAVLRRGPLTIAELAESVGAKRDTVKKALRRSRVFTAMTNAPDGVHRWALAESRTVQ